MVQWFQEMLVGRTLQKRAP
uniref:Uncharacterized protein n=1 Tax=Arundo donax TaxID=35708 RepID=A0A0A8Z798_ARUDO